MSSQPVTRPSLLIRIRDTGDQSAWSTFVAIYTPLIFGYCRGRTLQEADAADVTQEVMRAVASAVRQFEYDPVRGSFRSWLLVVTRSKLNNFLAARQRAPSPADDATIVRLLQAHESDGEERDWEREYRNRLFCWAAEQVRAEVRESTWRAFWQTAMEERAPAEVAAQLGLSVSSVYVARNRILTRLKALIAGVADGDPDLADVLK